MPPRRATLTSNRRARATAGCSRASRRSPPATRRPSRTCSHLVGTGYLGNLQVQVYLVRFFDNNGNAHQVEVDTMLPNGGIADWTNTAQNSNVLWVALAEKAYAEANGLSIVTTSHENLNCYSALTGGWPSWALQAIVGGINSGYEPADPNDLAMYWNWNDFIVLTTTTPSSSYIVGEHCYAVVGYNATQSQPFTIYNPWGVDSTKLWAQVSTTRSTVYSRRTRRSSRITSINSTTASTTTAARGN